MAAHYSAHTYEIDIYLAISWITDIPVLGQKFRMPMMKIIDDTNDFSRDYNRMDYSLSCTQNCTFASVLYSLPARVHVTVHSISVGWRCCRLSL